MRGLLHAHSYADDRRLGSLEAFLHQETGVPEDAVLAYLSDGRRLENANVREIAWGGSEVCVCFVHRYG